MTPLDWSEATRPLSHTSGFPLFSTAMLEATSTAYADCLAPSRLSSIFHDNCGRFASMPIGVAKDSHLRPYGFPACAFRTLANTNAVVSAAGNAAHRLFPDLSIPKIFILTSVIATENCAIEMQ